MTKKCKGCGIPLQITNSNKEGYTEDLNKDLCERCFKLKNYGLYQNVTLTNDYYKNIINTIPKNSLVVYVTSILNINLDYIDNFPNTIIVLTKKDLLPKSIKDIKLKNYISTITNNYKDIEVISAIKNYNLDSLIDKINKNNEDKTPVYFVGMTNSGKSTLINKLIKNYSTTDHEVTTSMYPSTTLNKIEITIGELTIIDTPGLLPPKSLLNKISNQEIKRITPKKEIKPRSYQLKGSGVLLIDNYARLDNYTENNITIYIANNLRVTRATKANKKYQDLPPQKFTLTKNKDIVIEDLCFIKFTKPGKIDIRTPYETSIYERNNLI